MQHLRVAVLPHVGAHHAAAKGSEADVGVAFVGVGNDVAARHGGVGDGGGGGGVDDFAFCGGLEGEQEEEEEMEEGGMEGKEGVAHRRKGEGFAGGECLKKRLCDWNMVRLTEEREVTWKREERESRQRPPWAFRVLFFDCYICMAFACDCPTATCKPHLEIDIS